MSEHRIFIGNSNQMQAIPSGSVQLIVTSPPYPMIEMWDSVFAEQNPEVAECLAAGDGLGAFGIMHSLLNEIWKECDRVLCNNGFICINVGDATRSIKGEFQLYSNNSAIISFFQSLGYSVLPDVHWRKQSNSPNKFMGSGMYPAGAYVTYEHEYILIFRKGGKREFRGAEKEARQRSAYFWEERNVWFSDLWDIKGTAQTIQSPRATRERNASYPLEIPYRLVSMYSVEGDTVLDPFAGLGTTNIACILTNRNSIGYEIDREIAKIALDNMSMPISALNSYISERVERHLQFIEELPEDKKSKCYVNEPHGFMVKTRQETAILISKLQSITRNGNTVVCQYTMYHPQKQPEQLAWNL